MAADSNSKQDSICIYIRRTKGLVYNGYDFAFLTLWTHAYTITRYTISLMKLRLFISEFTIMSASSKITVVDTEFIHSIVCI